MKTAIYSFFVLCLFVIAFSIELKFGFLRNANFSILESMIGPQGDLIINYGNIYSMAMHVAVLWAFIITLPFGDYVWCKQNRLMKEQAKKSIWQGSLLMVVLFLLGFVVAYGWLYFKIWQVGNFVDYSEIKVSLITMQLDLVKRQWALGLMFTVILIIIRKLRAEHA